MTYLRNCWYLVGWVKELDEVGWFARTIAEVPLLIMRTVEGGVSALLDRCPHRFAPLSCGKITDGQITCGYHAITFAADGRCLDNPHGAAISALTVPSFAAAVGHTGIWVWIGEQALADPATIPPLDLITRTPASAGLHGYEQIAANYQLCTDNILDLSHADSLHPTSLGGGATTRAQFTVKEHPDRIELNWFAPSDVAPPALDALLPEPNNPADVYLRAIWYAPSVMAVTLGGYPAGHRERGNPETWGIHVMTPSDAGKTHYFYWAGRNCLVEDADLTAMVAVMLQAAFAGEDKPMLEAQQSRVGSTDFNALGPALLRTDEGSVRVRRRLSKLIAAEAACAEREPA
ncbi:vanillate O-demethylase monooxygenase subunit [Novosphingobium chloroacetimidivorans]|uniref:Vanillate O-demethylase monooxygenase subunit n=1 Tax=Novosphingobium chloroacetimidivorans TaxID=1428314 RepID=A0A7W7KCH2_9SPHN|nr:aromatic ring-hydroxylating dioxygenase subunit alpha [Novosphingobium chloroacetimidivorans]MBB4860282.1 vanillate O-demethylase monooxygenase subunit [Novosphingobium chloroacetimidivorans]